MIFGPMMRSEAWKHADNYIFGEDREDENRDGDGMGYGDEWNPCLLFFVDVIE